jgi:NAD(P)-dependent dehydrogenase (short-subunit alcohol dehydrogenase family)
VAARPGASAFGVTNRIVGRTALVTGAGNGLGRAISIALAEHGARVVLVGRNTQKLDRVATEIHAALGDRAGTARVAACDTGDPASVVALAAELAEEDISILINNAGIAGPVASLVDITPQDWDAVFAVNVRGVYLMCAAFIPAMTEHGRGDVINVASVSGKRPLARRTPYTASKMAVIGLTTSLAYEVGPLGVNVNTLSPGPVRGPRMERNFRLEAERTGTSAVDAEEAFVSRSALHRMVEESEVAAAVIAMLHMPGLCAADIDLSAGMAAR